MVKLGRISYVNMAPVFYRVDAEVEEVLGVPTELNRLLLGGELDIAPISSIEYARNAERLRLLPRICVASEGAVESIQLVSRKPLEQVRVVAVTPEISLMRCAKCKAHALERLPANKFSNHPGYVCLKCGAKMRPPGSTGFNLFVILLGAFTLCFGLFIAVVAFASDTAAEYMGELLAGALALTVLGVAVAVWAGMQLALPIPLDAPPQKSRLLMALGIMLLVMVVGVALIGGCLFGIMYWIHEM